MLEAAPRIIDVGSNFGMSVFFFKYLYPNSTIIAFEPTPAIFELLKKNVQENGLQNVEVMNEAIVGQSGLEHVDIFVDPSGQDSATNSIVNNSGHGGTHTRTISVKATTLSSYLKGEAVCDILKMDIEGAEFGVMEEIEPYLNKVNCISIEIHQSPGAENDSIDKILGILHRNNFRYFIASCDYGTYKGYFKAYNIMVHAINLHKN
jgi:FkbM family methyltransferase